MPFHRRPSESESRRAGFGKLPLILGVIISVCLIAGVCSAGAGYRYWTSASGKRSTVRMELVEQSGDRVKLKREDNGCLVEVPVTSLSEEDQELVKEAAESGNISNTSNHNWPQFRGPFGSGVSPVVGLPSRWSATKNIAWQTRLPGPGGSSPITFGEHVYVTCYSGYGLNVDSPGDQSALKRHLVCLDRQDGSIAWTATMDAGGAEKPYTDFALQLHGYASNTPAADASGVYVFYGPSGAAAYSHTGDLKWRASCGTGSHVWGCSASVVLGKDLVFLNAQLHSDSLIALDKQSGKEVWRQRGLPGPFHTPLLIDDGESSELIVQHNHGTVSGLDPATGNRLWDCKVFDDYLNASPIAHDGIVYLIGGSSGHAAAVRTGGRGDVTGTHKLWELNKGSYVSSAIYYEGHLYWSRDDGGIVYCANARTGELVYEQRLRPKCGRVYGSPVAADGKLYYVSREHGTYVLSAGPEFELLAHNVIETDRSIFNGSPAIGDRSILLRSDSHLYCIATE